ncbi:MAG: hypothetical protein NDJ18_01000 [candidate division Zixibacteria bacterium]|nr:hypothetical protein [candidate division Zixibacteria bacterium]
MRQTVQWILVCLSLLLITGRTEATSLLPPPPNIRITTIPQLNNEEQVFICPTDSNIIIANWRDFRLGYRQIGIGRSTDGGLTWVDSLIDVGMQYFNFSAWQSDPTLAVDRLGNFYMSVLDFLPAGGLSSSVISFYRSLDKGVSWEGPYIPDPPPGTTFEDKQFITVDRTGGAHDGNLYCAWARFYEGPNRIMFVRSTDGGVTFDDSVTIGPVQGSTGCGFGYDAGQFAIPIVGANGEVHVFWMGTSLDSGLNCTGSTQIKHRVSLDGGLSFGPEKKVHAVTGYMMAAGSVNTYSMPVGDVDISGGPYHGNLYLAFSTIGPEGGLSDVDLIRSSDGGATWSDRIRINDDDSTELNSNFHPWLIVNEDGAIISVFYDERYDPNHYSFDLIAAYSFDGGQTFTSNHRISSVSSSPSNAREVPGTEPIVIPAGMDHPALAMSPMAGKLGEYIGVTAFHDKINAVWTDTRDGNQEIYTANWYVPVLEPRLLAPSDSLHLKADSTSYGLLPPELVWSTSWKEGEDLYLIEITPPVGDIDTFASSTNSFSGWAGEPPVPVSYVSGWYSWRVRTLKSDLSDSSEWSTSWTFYLDTEPPSQPSLLSPANGAVITDLTPLMDWTNSTDVGGAVLYDLYLSTDPGLPAGPSTIVQSGLTTSEYQITSNLAADTFYWKIVVSDNVGWTTVSAVNQFRTSASCCIGVTGNVNKSSAETPDLSDLSLLIAYLTNAVGVLPCPAEANINGAGAIDITDLSWLIARLTSLIDPPTLPNCP